MVAILHLLGRGGDENGPSVMIRVRVGRVSSGLNQIRDSYILLFFGRFFLLHLIVFEICATNLICWILIHSFPL